MNNLKELKERVLHEIGAFLVQTNFCEAKKFSIYDDVFFSERKMGASECITVGFHQRKGSSEMHVFLLKTCVKTIEENIKKLQLGEKVKPLNAIVFTVNFSLKKHWFRIHPDFGHFIDGSFLEGSTGRVFSVITTEIQKMGSAHFFRVPLEQLS